MVIIVAMHGIWIGKYLKVRDNGIIELLEQTDGKEEKKGNVSITEYRGKFTKPQLPWKAISIIYFRVCVCVRALEHPLTWVSSTAQAFASRM